MKPISRKRIQESENRRKTKRGAVRSKKQPASKRRLPLVRIALFGLLLAASAWSSTQVDWRSGYDRVRQMVSRPIQHVEVKGQFRFLEEAAVHKILQGLREDSFIRANLGTIKRKVEQVPWVERVSISRVWPDGIVISVEEQTPIARWGESGFINQYGEIVTAQQVSELRRLPLLYGEEARSHEITRTYLEVADLLATKGVYLRGLYLDEKRAWQLHLNNDIEIVVGRDDVIQKLRNFLYVYDRKLKKHEADIERIDLRYRSGLAVRWKAKDEQMANSNINRLQAKVN